jgi:PhnB protein
MTSTLNPYLGFRDNAREAMEFYQGVFGGKLDVSTFGQFGTQGADADKVMHAQLNADNGFVLMGSDTPAEMEYNAGGNITVSLSGDDADDLRGYWEKLSANGTVTMPLQKQMWGDEFGMCIDQFGIPWMVNIAGGQS